MARWSRRSPLSSVPPSSGLTCAEACLRVAGVVGAAGAGVALGTALAARVDVAVRAGCGVLVGRGVRLGRGVLVVWGVLVGRGVRVARAAAFVWSPAAGGAELLEAFGAPLGDGAAAAYAAEGNSVPSGDNTNCKSNKSRTR